MIVTIMGSLGGALMALATVTSAVATISDPVNGSLTPKALPGATMEYTLTFTNNSLSSLDSGTVALKDPIPANTKLYVGDLGATGSGPLAFGQGIPGSGMTYTFTSLASTSDDLEFSKDGGTTWTYTPVADSSGCDALVTHVRIRPKGTAASLGVFTAKFRVVVK